MASLKPAEIVTPMNVMSLETENAIRPKLNCVLRNKILYEIDIELIKSDLSIKYKKPFNNNNFIIISKSINNNAFLNFNNLTVK